MRSGLTDGIFSNKRTQLVYISEGLVIENIGIFYGRLVYFSGIGHILRLLDMFYFSFWYVVQRKIWQPWMQFRTFFICMYVCIYVCMYVCMYICRLLQSDWKVDGNVFKLNSKAKARSWYICTALFMQVANCSSPGFNSRQDDQMRL
jgi:hypothetical protein